MIQIEILTTSASKVRAAFYYEVPDSVYSPVSYDSSRSPAGSALTPEEVTLLKEGRLYEYIAEGDPSGRTIEQIHTALEALWDARKSAARAEYVAAYSYAGTVWRDGTWQ